MESTLRVASIAFNTTAHDVVGNTNLVLQALKEAHAAGANVVVFPETVITGYGNEDGFPHQGFLDEAMWGLKTILPNTNGLVCAVGLPLAHKGRVFNVAAVMSDGKLLGFYAKQNLAGDGIHYEPRQFGAWPKGAMATYSMGDDSIGDVPLGDIHFEVDGVKIGIEICEDAWMAERPGHDLDREGMDLLLILNASHFGPGKWKTRERFCVDASRAFHCAVAYSNLLGNEAGTAVYDGHCLIANGGALVAADQICSLRQIEIVMADVNLEQNRIARRRQFALKPQVEENPRCVRYESAVKFNEPQMALAEFPSVVSIVSRQPDSEFKEVAFALHLGLLDYLLKSRANGFMLCLSGGADSSFTAVSISDAVQRAFRELTGAEIGRRFGMLPYVQGQLALGHGIELFIVQHLILRCVYMKAGGSSTATEEAARELATELSCQFDVLDIEHEVKALREKVEQALGRKLSWDNPADDITLQNLPARVRGLLGWTFANAENRLLLPPSNLSEAMVGYFTQGGDDSGGLNPIGSLPKTWILRWLKWRKNFGFVYSAIGRVIMLPRIAALTFVVSAAPSAELRVGDKPQTDEGDLGPYEVRDRITELFLHEGAYPMAAFNQLVQEFSEKYTEEELALWTWQFYQRFRITQWKRVRGPVTLKIWRDDAISQGSLRWPVLNRAWEKDLDELKSLFTPTS